MFSIMSKMYAPLTIFIMVLIDDQPALAASTVEFHQVVTPLHTPSAVSVSSVGCCTLSTKSSISSNVVPCPLSMLTAGSTGTPSGSYSWQFCPAGSMYVGKPSMPVTMPMLKLRHMKSTSKFKNKLTPSFADYVLG